MEEVTSVNWGGIIITEPMTAFTNLLLSILGITFFLSLKKNNSGNIVTTYWSNFFLFFGTATFIGVITHGFTLYLGDIGYKFLKTVMNLINMVGILYSVKATITYASYNDVVTKKANKIFLSLFVLFSSLTIIVNFLNMPPKFNNFVFVTINSAISLVFVVFVYYKSYKNGNKLSGNLLFGMGISFITVYIFLAKVTISEWFNHKDISHVIMMVSIYFVYRGAILNEKSLQKRN